MDYNTTEVIEIKARCENKKPMAKLKVMVYFPDNPQITPDTLEN
ncbi:MAG: hypothetical protein NZ901_11170 [Geminocystis sp.]|nr:hypothetical protein [Geminocystis sp.]MCS7148732.1 hypothetical protein [Geminocystis sp.]MCX8078394.1 hypothetical protein [Geminocystis sp.]MDW8116119.1 hypothetical protein [Geminocystis sp.]MDW8463541.1 hypothetical protein [Geminocystis sp.]